MASALYGTVLGALFGGWPTDRLGRKATLLWIGLLYNTTQMWYVGFDFEWYFWWQRHKN